MIIGPKKIRETAEKSKLNGDNIEYVKKFKYLGI